MAENLHGKLTVGNLYGKLTVANKLSGTLSSNKNLSGQLNLKVIESTNYDYNKLDENTLPQINNVMLKGNRSASDIKVQDKMDQITDQDIDELLFG